MLSVNSLVIESFDNPLSWLLSSWRGCSPFQPHRWKTDVVVIIISGGGGVDDIGAVVDDSLN